MKKFLFLSSAFLMTMAGANAADKIITSENTCTVDVLGVSDNNAVANTIATWDAIEYTLDPGEYLSVTETSVHKAPCPSGSYCGGGTEFTVDNAATSIATCPPTHPNSATGAGADTQCYTACTVDMVAKATAVTGNDYFGTGVDTCGATACETGYHVDGGGLELVEKTPLIPVDYTLAGYNSGYISADGNNTYQTTEYGLTANNTWASEFDYGVIYGKASCQPQIRDASMEYISTNMPSIMSGEMTIEEFESGMLPLAGKEKTDYMVKILTEGMDGSVSEEEMYEEIYKALFVVFGREYDANYATDSSGQYCYCQMDGFMPNGGTREIVTSAPWVFLTEHGSADDCAYGCVSNCANLLPGDAVHLLAFRAAVVGALEAVETGGICAANTINIKWDPANKGAVIENQCTYDGAITVPADPVKPGYTFSGWKLLENTTTE